MLARLQQITTLSLILAATAWAFHFLNGGEWMKAWVGALLILLGYALFLALEFVLLAFIRGSDPAPTPSGRQLLGAWLTEAITAPLVFCWRQPFRSHAEADLVPTSTTSSRGVVLVHGFVCNRALWNPWMARLRSARIPFIAVNLEPVFGSIDDYVSVIERAVQRLEAATGQAPVVVAHSMGGLAVRAWLATMNADARVHRVVTIGTPHRGTWLARFGQTTNARQMRIDGAWLRALAQREPAARFAKFTCIYSHCDNIVFPATTATLPGARNLHITGTAHVHLAFQGAAFEELLRWVQPDAAVTA
jgi:triacylglycerol lipase